MVQWAEWEGWSNLGLQLPGSVWKAASHYEAVKHVDGCL